MRTSVLAGRSLLLLAIGLGSACKGEKGSSEAAAKVVEDSTAISKKEEDMLARRDALLNTRQRIQKERKELRQQYAEVRAKGGDTSELDKKAKELNAEEGKLVDEEGKLNKRYEEIISQRKAMISALANVDNPAARVAGREAQIASREKEVARREKTIAEREAALAKRESQMAARWKEGCAVGATPTTIIQTVDAKGSSYTKRDVEPLLRRARRQMSRKGILRSDLASPVRSLEQEATKAMKKGDYGRARFAAAQLVATVRSIKIDRAFVAAKIGRLSASMKGRKLPPDKQRRVDKLFKEAISYHGDGRFRRANSRLNRIYATIN